jgi:hypothetical protein
MSQFKNDIVQQSIIISHQMGENFVKTAHSEQQKCSFNRNDGESQSEKQVSVINAIETRRLHQRLTVRGINTVPYRTVSSRYGTV